MIYYPIENMLKAGIDNIMILPGKDHAGDFAKLLGSGKDFNARFSFIIQDFAGGNGQMMYERMAEIVGQIANQTERLGKSGYSNVGMIVGGISGEVAAALRQKYEKIWFLVPGYGSQGATADDCVRFCKSDGTGALINASRSIIYAYEKPQYKEQFGDDWKRCIEQAVIDAKVDLANAANRIS